MAEPSYQVYDADEPGGGVFGYSGVNELDHGCCQVSGDVDAVFLFLPGFEGEVGKVYSASSGAQEVPVEVYRGTEAGEGHFVSGSVRGVRGVCWEREVESVFDEVVYGFMAQVFAYPGLGQVRGRRVDIVG